MPGWGTEPMKLRTQFKPALMRHRVPSMLKNLAELSSNLNSIGYQLMCPRAGFFFSIGREEGRRRERERKRATVLYWSTFQMPTVVRIEPETSQELETT